MPAADTLAIVALPDDHDTLFPAIVAPLESRGVATRCTLSPVNSEIVISVGGSSSRLRTAAITKPTAMPIASVRSTARPVWSWWTA